MAIDCDAELEWKLVPRPLVYEEMSGGLFDRVTDYFFDRTNTSELRLHLRNWDDVRWRRERWR